MRILRTELFYNANIIFPVSGKQLLRMVIVTTVFAVLLFPRTNAQDLDVPYVSTPHYVVEKMLDVADVGPGDYVIDLGCGDGRIVIAAAQRGAVGHGVDIDPERIKEARENARKADVADQVMFLQEDLFETDFRRATVITMYLLSSVSIELRPRLLDSLNPGTRVVSHDFDIGYWEPDEYIMMGEPETKPNDWKSGSLMESDKHEIYCWMIPADIEGQWDWQADGKSYTMTVEQDLQKIKPRIVTGGDTLSIKSKVLKGDRINLTALAPGDSTRYVFNGHIEDNQIKGKVQIHNTTTNVIKNWSANKK